MILRSDHLNVDPAAWLSIKLRYRYVLLIIYLIIRLIFCSVQTKQAYCSSS